MAATVFFADPANELATLANTFSVSGTPTDPTTVSLTVTDPTGATTTYTYNPGTIQRTGTGAYAQTVACTKDGLWQYEWTGTGVATDVQVGTFTVQAPEAWKWYCSLEEVKSRVGKGSSDKDFEITIAVRAAARDIEQFCGRHFYQVTDTRTYVPEDIWVLTTDDIVSVSALTLDYQGNGVYANTWIQGTDFVLEVADQNYNQSAGGELRPFTRVRSVGGQWFPYIWPFVHMDRVKIQGVFGWPAVPTLVKEAALLIATDYYKAGEAPFGQAGFAEYATGGAIKSTDEPLIANMLRSYVRPRRKVGC